jgi:hypothetical protein
MNKNQQMQIFAQNTFAGSVKINACKAEGKLDDLNTSETG